VQSLSADGRGRGRGRSTRRVGQRGARRDRGKRWQTQTQTQTQIPVGTSMQTREVGRRSRCSVQCAAGSVQCRKTVASRDAATSNEQRATSNEAVYLRGQMTAIATEASPHHHGDGSDGSCHKCRRYQSPLRCQRHPSVVTCQPAVPTSNCTSTRIPQISCLPHTYSTGLVPVPSQS
jgi:hypothetical protein